MPKLTTDRRNRTKTWTLWGKIFQSKILGFCETSQVDKWVSWTHFWSFRVARGLYICIKHLLRELRVFLVVIPASGAVFRPIFVHGVPTRTLETSTHARSLTLRSSTEVIFCHETLSYMTENGRIRSLRRKSNPRVTETVQNWVLWVKKCPWSWHGYFISNSGFSLWNRYMVIVSPKLRFFRCRPRLSERIDQEP